MSSNLAFTTYGILLVASPFLLSISYPNVDGIHMDVKCTLYKNNDTDVRIFVMGLKGDTAYTAEVKPDHNPPFTVTSKTDPQGILWIVSKVQNGGISLDFKVTVYEGKEVSNPVVVIKGDDDAPCRPLSIKDHTSIEILRF
ncbi:MAG TPA: hypothetical protein VJ772_02985 [Nitrososphaeraceae archaeon]|nr:hypothetical protein [Nitrososphaeraceae archaeon]